jgi:hypothetical protein
MLDALSKPSHDIWRGVAENRIPHDGVQMAEGQSRRRSDRFVIAIFALVGAVIGFLLFLILIEPSPVEQPVMMSVSTPLGPNSSAT